MMRAGAGTDSYLTPAASKDAQDRAQAASLLATLGGLGQGVL
jgi:hypothetical protein